MAAGDETVRLVFDVKTTDVAAARAQVDQLDSSVKRVETSLNDASGVNSGGRRGVAGFGQAMLNAGRMVDDFNAAGLRGIVNNFEGMALSLGLGSGIAGAATIAAVALNLLLPKLQAMSDQGGTLKSEMGQLADEIAKLDGKKVKLEADTTALNRLKEELKQLEAAAENFQAIISGQNKYEAASGKALSEVIVETAGGQEALAATRASVVSGATSTVDRDIAGKRARLAQLKAEQATLNPNEPNSPRARAIRAEIRSLEADLGVLSQERDITAANAGSVFDTALQTAMKGTGAEQAGAQSTIAATLEKFGAPGGGALAAAIRGVSPDSFVAKARDKELTDALMKEGAANEAAALMQLERAKREQEEDAAIADARWERETSKAEETGKALTEQRRAREQRQKDEEARQAAQLAAQQQAIAMQREQANIGAEAGNLAGREQMLMAQIRQAQAMGATQLQLQEAFGRDLQDVQRGWFDLRMRLDSLSIKRQQAANSHQRRFAR